MVCTTHHRYPLVARASGSQRGPVDIDVNLCAPVGMQAILSPHAQDGDGDGDPSKPWHQPAPAPAPAPLHSLVCLPTPDVIASMSMSMSTPMPMPTPACSSLALAGFTVDPSLDARRAERQPGSASLARARPPCRRPHCHCASSASGLNWRSPRCCRCRCRWCSSARQRARGLSFPCCASAPHRITLSLCRQFWPAHSSCLPLLLACCWHGTSTSVYLLVLLLRPPLHSPSSVIARSSADRRSSSPRRHSLPPSTAKARPTHHTHSHIHHCCVGH